MLDDQHGIPQITQMFQNGDQPFGILRMQARCRFVQHDQKAGHFQIQRRRHIELSIAAPLVICHIVPQLIRKPFLGSAF